MSAFGLSAVEVLLLIPAIAVPVLALVSGYRLGSIINVIACGLTFTAGLALLFAARARSELLIVDDFNIFFVVLTTFVGFTTS
ncbi:MAG TPA: hydrogenase 4 subunit F, partial [Xanthobacteraceae bacterium]|nr:hydrogenase 4 subunit F [Xanthobacteraceae bacterium]